MSADERVRYLEEVNYALAHAVGRPRTVLDVGCGRGQNGEHVRSKGAYVVGLESDPASLAAARARLDEVHSVDIETDDALQPIRGRKFDLLVFGDVLEHVREPSRVLERFAALLDDGGHVIVSLPNVAAWTVRLGLLAGHFDYAPSGILDETHLRFFTKKAAISLVEGAGLEVLWTGLNPMLVRAALGPLRAVLSRGDPDPASIAKNPAYAAYLRYVRPAEGALASVAPGLLAFQHVVVARRRPEVRDLTVTVGMLAMNEGTAVGAVIDGIRAHVPGAEVVLVDSSNDDTPRIAEAKGARVLRQFPARGYGPAMATLLRSATTDVIVTMDCDGTYPVGCVNELVARVRAGADLVNASRMGHRPKAMPLPNYVGNRVFAACTTLLHGLPTKDVHSGMRAYRTSMLRAIDVDENGPALPVDLLVLPARLGYRVEEVDIPYGERIGVSTLNRLESTLWTFRRLARDLGKGRRFPG